MAGFVASFLVLSSVFSCYRLSEGANYIALQTIEDCKTGPTDDYHEAYDISKLECRRCSQKSDIQTVSSDGLRCVCQPGYKLTKDYGGAGIECEACPANQVTSADKWNCVSCDQNNYNSVSKQCTACAQGQVAFERNIDGSWYSGTPSRTCTTCTTSTTPDSSSARCVRCNQVLSVLPSQTNCQCPDSLEVGGVCFGSISDIIADSEDLYKVKFGDTTVRSKFFVDNIRAAYGMCQETYANLTACQVLGNLCVLTVYDDSGTTSSQVTTACEGYNVLATSEQPANMPWLFYEDTPDSILKDTRITTKYKFPNDQLKLRAAVYMANGTFVGLEDLTGGVIQLCKSSEDIMNAAYIFGTTYEQTCDISVKSLYDSDLYPANFFDLYLEYTDEGANNMYAVPVKITNLEKNKAGSQTKDWKLVRRFFLVDNLSGIKSLAAGEQADDESQGYVRYAKTMKLWVNLQENTKEGQIYPPFLEITYAYVTPTDFQENKKVTVTFSVSYSMTLDKYNDDIRIAMGVLCAFACVYSFLQTWAWSKRAGKIGIDFFSIMKYVLFGINNVANVFFVVSFGASIWWLIFYKRQDSVYLLMPTREQEETFIIYVSLALALKFLHIIHFMVAQVTVDIFFVDWERPRGRKEQQEKGSQDLPVSIWRTYFIANEWNEIQTCRKINSILQIFAVIFFLDVLGLENLATADPQGSTTRDPDQYYAPDSRIFRFAIAALTYLLIAVAQWVFYTFIYERFFEDKVRQYVDLCSLSNISVFILENAQYGYYIHGRSVHGRADTDMREMHANLKREEDDLCGQRGLVPDSDKQTFQIAIPRKLREHYELVMMPIKQPQQGAATVARTGQGVDVNIEKTLVGYKNLTILLHKFIDHSLKNIDYIIKNKLLFESILGIEFQDSSEKGFFYNDSGHSFDAVLFYGNEETLTLFEVLIFTVTDIIFSNYVLSAVVTYVFMQVVTTIRDSLGRHNLAKKTLVDKRFLI